MSAKPWADPRATLDERLVAAEIAIANVDTAPDRRAIMRELVEGERQLMALREAGRRHKDALRALADAPGG